jgi:hypothetical protein
MKKREEGRGEVASTQLSVVWFRTPESAEFAAVAAGACPLPIWHKQRRSQVKVPVLLTIEPLPVIYLFIQNNRNGPSRTIGMPLLGHVWAPVSTPTLHTLPGLLHLQTHRRGLQLLQTSETRVIPQPQHFLPPLDPLCSRAQRQPAVSSRKSTSSSQSHPRASGYPPMKTTCSMSPASSQAQVSLTLPHRGDPTHASQQTAGTPYQGGYFRVSFNFTEEFPNAPPKCKLPVTVR